MENIYFNKYNIQTVEWPIIPDVAKILSEDKEVHQFTSKEEFENVLSQQSYFSAGYSHCFYSIHDMNDWHRSHVKDRCTRESIMLFESGHKPVALWDHKNQIGYIIKPN